MPPTWPMIQLLGNSLGQYGSTLNFGASGTLVVPAAEATDKAIPIANLSRSTAGIGRIPAMCIVFSHREGLRKLIGCKQSQRRITLRRRARNGNAERRAGNLESWK